MEKCTQMPIEVIDGCNLLLGPITHETKPLDVTIGSHTNKVVFNVISFPRNIVIIGLSWLVLHNPQVEWHTKSLHFEAPQCKALECETLINGTRKPTCPKPLFVGEKTFMKVATKGDAFFIYILLSPNVEPCPHEILS
jgi:hypothetical protein